MNNLKDHNWEKSNIQKFWSEIAPFDHILQIYETEKIFLDSLEGYVGTGFLAGDAVIIIATKAHTSALNKRLKHQGFDLELIESGKQYILLDCEETLSRFMINGSPDEYLFNQVVGKVIGSLNRNPGKKIRAFGEMVAVLWSQGNKEAAIELEYLWNKYFEKDEFCLFCAYPKSSLSKESNASIQNICQCHSKIIGGWPKPSTEIYYKTSN